MELANEKAKELYGIAAGCRVNAVEVLDDIVASMETAQATVHYIKSSWQQLSSPLSQHFWVVFSQEWCVRCFVRYLGKCRDLEDYQRMQDLWLRNFEPLWVIGYDIARNDRLNAIRETIESEPPPPELDSEEVWQWVKAYDEAALEISDLFKERQRRVITQHLKELRECDEDSLFEKLKCFMWPEL